MSEEKISNGARDERCERVVAKLRDVSLDLKGTDSSSCTPATPDSSSHRLSGPLSPNLYSKIRQGSFSYHFVAWSSVSVGQCLAAKSHDGTGIGSRAGQTFLRYQMKRVSDGELVAGCCAAAQCVGDGLTVSDSFVHVRR